MPRIKLGVAFAGGGVRGSAHLGIMQALHENNIYPEIYAGTSAGSIVASLLAHGYEPEQALQEFLVASENLVDVAFGHIAKGAFTSSAIEGVIAGKALEGLLHGMFNGANLSQVENKLAIVTTDIDLGRQVIFTNSYQGIDEERINDTHFSVVIETPIDFESTPLSHIVRASCGMPAIFIPKIIGGRKLVDGGIANNLPSDVAWAMGADKVISMDLGYAGEVQTEGIIDIAHMSINLLMKRVTDGNRHDFGLYLNPSIYDVTSLDTDKIQECFERGYTYGISKIDEVVKMLEEGSDVHI